MMKFSNNRSRFNVLIQVTKNMQKSFSSFKKQEKSYNLFIINLNVNYIWKRVDKIDLKVKTEVKSRKNIEKKIISDFRTHFAATGSAFATRRNLHFLKVRTFPRNRFQRPNRRNLDVGTPTGSFRFHPVFRFQRRVESAERHGRKKRRRPDSNRRFSSVRR